MPLGHQSDGDLRATIFGQWNPIFSPSHDTPCFHYKCHLPMGQVPGPFTLECFLCYSLTLFFFCTFLHSLSPTLKRCIQLAKPGKLPLVSVNQEKNSGTHILMITELGKKHCFPLHQYLFCSVVGVPSRHQLVFLFRRLQQKGYPMALL